MNRSLRLDRPVGILALLAFAIALLVPASITQADPEAQPARIGGIVTDANGDAVEGAIVQIASERGRVMHTVRTDERGFYAFNRLRPGVYVVRAGKRDVGRDRARVAVRSGETERVPLTLE